ncbi:MAG: hypothetical protein Q9195_007216 [Heterodermia aff. obscurata]
MLGGVILCIWLASIFFCGESLKLKTPSQVPFIRPSEVGTMDSAPPHIGKPIPQDERDTWNVACNSELAKHECDRIIDGSNTTFWQTEVDTESVDSLHHNIKIDLGEIKNVNAISMRPLPDADLGGAIAGHKVYLSVDDKDEKKWELVAFGTWFEDVQDKFATFEPRPAQFVRLEANSATNGTQFIRIVSIDVWATSSPTPSSHGLGKWGPTVDFPLVPVGAFIDPLGGKVITFSSYAHDSFGQGVSDHTTFTASWDPTTETISHRHVRETHHDMFCPGMAFDVDGRMIISGGESADKVSIYDPMKDDWISVQGMKIARGYQGSATCANGHIFVIGGSWGPVGIDLGDRKGETYDPAADKWSLLSEVRSEDIATTMDWEGEYRSDNHVWLMGWKNNSIFHAGPSKDMHWITLTENGAIQHAGRRGINDTMCGVAAMYDAVEGKILAAGGASSYNYKDGYGNIKGGKATADAFIITLGDVNTPVKVEPAGRGMHSARSFGHAVILPNGETLVVGGQAEPRVFTEDTGQLVPEIYSPTTKHWTQVAPNSIVRAYHSFALLLRDATVLIGGSGLTIQLDVNHFDAQIYTPQYLLTANGERAKRPLVLQTSATTVLPGGNFTITTDTEVVAASLVRYGGATHSLNNDQRCIPLTLYDTGTLLEYAVVIPEDGGVAIPGPWMLFVMDEHGVPSVASSLQIAVTVARD